jgi:folylpolyglutamate synthase/dihydropteroate synthase
MADHDWAGVVGRLATAVALEGARIITTQLASPRATPAVSLAAAWQALGRGVSVEAQPDLERALAASIEAGDGPILVAGSLYLVGEARRRWLDDPLLRDPEVLPA